jgi:D-apionate oxidoisomerase
VFLERTTKEQHASTFGGIAAPQDGVAAIENGDDAARDLVEAVLRVAYGPVLDVHWVTVKQLAVLEPTLVETVAWMIGGRLKEALHETVHTVGAPEPAAKAMLFGHVQVALANTLRGSNLFSDAWLIAMDYGREPSSATGKIFDYNELDKVITRMLRIDRIEHAPA